LTTDRAGSLRAVYRGWTEVGLLLSKVTTPIVMSAIFAVVIVPVALVMRVMKRNPMHRAFEPEVASYRIKRRSGSNMQLIREDGTVLYERAFGATTMYAHAHPRIA
jgi:hypothetical protein